MSGDYRLHAFDAAVALAPQGDGSWQGHTSPAYANMVGEGGFPPAFDGAEGRNSRTTPWVRDKAQRPLTSPRSPRLRTCSFRAFGAVERR